MIAAEPFLADPRLFGVRESAFSEWPHHSFVKKGVVIPLGATNDFDDVRVYNPSVLSLNGRLYCYYAGYDGSKYLMGLAISKDGVHFVKKGVVIPLGADGDFDVAYTYDPSVLSLNGRLYCYYVGRDASRDRVGLAISKDGVHFVKKGVVIPLGATNDFDDVYTYNPSVLSLNGRVYCYYAGYDGSNGRVGLAISKDGVHFVKKGVVIPLGADGDFDDVYTDVPSVLSLNGRLYCYYAGYDGSKYRIGLAISKDGVHFVKKGVVIPLGATNDFDDVHVYNSSVLSLNGRLYCYYSGYDGSKYLIGLAISKDGL